MVGRGSLNRRSFLKGAATAGIVSALPAIIPATVLGDNAPSNRIVMGGIGLGGMGRGDMNGFLRMSKVQYVAVCDVDANHRQKAKDMADKRYNNQDCKTYLDYRELIGRGDLDAVMIATPDHWHAIPAIAAARAGLDIHAQKPLARSIREGRAICDAVHRYGVVWQTGSQQRSERNFRFACELVRNGRIGKIHKVEVGLPTGRGCGVVAPSTPPESLDWDRWLGPAPYRPFCSFGRGDNPHWNWRWIMDYSGGQLTDWAGHHIDIAQWGLGFERTGPVTVEGEGVYPREGLFDVPTEYRFTCKYANGIELTVANSAQLAQGAKWYGDKGWVYVRRGRLEANPIGLLKEEIGPDEVQLYRSPGHKQDFINCISTRKETVAPVEIGHRSISVGLLGEIAMLTGRKIHWNPKTEEIANDRGASALLGKSYREPWTL